MYFKLKSLLYNYIINIILLEYEVILKLKELIKASLKN